MKALTLSLLLLFCTSFCQAGVNDPISANSRYRSKQTIEYTEKPNFIHIRMLNDAVSVEECTQGVPVRVGTIDVEHKDVDQQGRRYTYMKKRKLLMVYTGNHRVVELLLKSSSGSYIYRINVAGATPEKSPPFNPFLPDKVR